MYSKDVHEPPTCHFTMEADAESHGEQAEGAGPAPLPSAAEATPGEPGLGLGS